MELLVAGGDRRHELLCALARARGWHVMSMGLPESGACAGMADVAVLPAPYAREGYIPAPLTDARITLEDVAVSIRPGAQVLCGGVDEQLSRFAVARAWKVRDIYAEAAFARRNALPSAEGAIYAAMRAVDFMIAGSRCMIVGFGRIGQMLAMQLMGLGANVRVAARRAESRTLAECMGCEAVDIAALELAVRGCSIIFNTVPATTLDAKRLAQTDDGALVVELASAPYGVDFDAAQALGVRVLREGGVPGRYCPRTAALIILDALETAGEAV